jgi:hypothetical protein
MDRLAGLHRDYRGIDCGALRTLLLACPVTRVLPYDQEVEQKSTCPFLQTWFVGQDARIMSVNSTALGSD